MFLTPVAPDASEFTNVPNKAIIESPQWQNDISYQFYY
jgi:hypothetical protein